MAKNYTQKRTGPGGGRDRKLFRKPRPSHGPFSPFLNLPSPFLFFAFFFLSFSHTNLPLLRLIFVYFPLFPFRPSSELSLSLSYSLVISFRSLARARAQTILSFSSRISPSFSLFLLYVHLSLSRAYFARIGITAVPLSRASPTHACIYARCHFPARWCAFARAVARRRARARVLMRAREAEVVVA